MQFVDGITIMVIDSEAESYTRSDCIRNNVHEY